MPFPFALIGAAAAAGGGALNYFGARQARKALDAAIQKEYRRQGKLRQEALEQLQGHLPTLGAESAQGQIQAGQANREQAYDEAADLRFGQDDPTSAIGQAQLNMLGQNKARQGGYQDWLLDQGIADIRARSELNRIANFASGSANALSSELARAQNAGAGLRAAGSAISGAGSILGLGLQLNNLLPSATLGAGVAPQPVPFGGEGLLDAPGTFYGPANRIYF